jgi:lipoprotein-releasing system permease protein
MIRLLVAIAARHLLARRRQSIVSLLGVVLGVSFFLSISAMMRGSELDIIRRLVDNAPHVTIEDQYRNPTLQPVVQRFPDAVVQLHHVVPQTETRGIRGDPQVLDFLRRTPGLQASAVLGGQALVSFAGKDRAVALNGIVADEYARVSTIRRYMIHGSLDELAVNPNGIVIGDELARLMSVSMGDNLRVASPTGQVRTFRVVGLFHTGRSDVDAGQAFVALKRVQSLLERPNRINTIVMKLADPNTARAEAARIERRVLYKTVSWQERSEDLMSALVIRRVIMFAVVGAVLVVAAFGIYNVISTVVLEKQRDIAILRAMGFEARDIERMFLAQGVLIGAVGNLFGIGLGCVFMAGLARIHFRIPGSTDITYMAIDWSPLQFLLAGGVAMLAAMTAAFLPARRAAKVEPVDVLRGGT